MHAWQSRWLELSPVRRCRRAEGRQGDGACCGPVTTFDGTLSISPPPNPAHEAPHRATGHNLQPSSHHLNGLPTPPPPATQARITYWELSLRGADAKEEPGSLVSFFLGEQKGTSRTAPPSNPSPQFQRAWRT